MRKVSLWLKLLGSAALTASVGCTTSGHSQDASAMGAWAGGPTAPHANSTVSPDDPTSLAHKLPTPGPDLFVATAHMYEQTNNDEDAAAQYERALKVDSNYLPALLGYAQLHDGRQEYSAADKLYQQAIKKHPKDPSIYNDWAMSYERRSKLPEAIVTMSKAIELEPQKPLYRNNLAMMMVELNKPDEAYRQLVAVNSPAVAHYNLAALLHRKGNDALAAQHFALAASDPTLPQARQWANRLAANTGTALPPMASMAQPPEMTRATPVSAQFEGPPPVPREEGVQIASRPAIVVENVAPLPPTCLPGRNIPPSGSVQYPQPVTVAAAQGGEMPPAPNQMRALPPVINALPPLY